MWKPTIVAALVAIAALSGCRGGKPSGTVNSTATAAAPRQAPRRTLPRPLQRRGGRLGAGGCEGLSRSGRPALWKDETRTLSLSVDAQAEGYRPARRPFRHRRRPRQAIFRLGARPRRRVGTDQASACKHLHSVSGPHAKLRASTHLHELIGMILGRLRLLFGSAVLALTTLGATASSGSPATPSSAHAIIARMADRNPTLRSYRARVHVDIRMYNFPYFAPKLDGTSYFKRPNFYVVVFDRMPSYARGFGRLFNDIGNPSGLGEGPERDVDGMAWLANRPVIVLRTHEKDP